MDIASAARLLLLAAIWGGSFLFMRIGAPVFGAGLLAELRVGVAALFLWGVCRWLRRRLPVRALWRHYLVIGLLNSALPFLMFAYAAQTLSASLLAILNSSSPIFGALVGAIWLRQRVSATAAFGLVLGMAGVATLAWDGVALKGGSAWVALAASLVAALSYSIAGTYAKRAQAALDPTDIAHGRMWAAALVALPFALTLPAPATPSHARVATPAMPRTRPNAAVALTRWRSQIAPTSAPKIGEDELSIASSEALKVCAAYANIKKGRAELSRPITR